MKLLKFNLLVFASVVMIFSSLHSQELHQDQRPNILFAISDDASFPHKSAYGTEWVQTPAFQQMIMKTIRCRNRGSNFYNQRNIQLIML